MKNLLFLLFFLLFSCSEEQHEAKNLSSNASPQELTIYDENFTDTIVTNHAILTFSKASKVDFLKLSKTSKAIDSLKKMYPPQDVDSLLQSTAFLKDIISTLKPYFKENVEPYIDWDKKLNIFLKLDSTLINATKIYSLSSLMSTEVEYPDDIPQSFRPNGKYNEFMYFILQDIGALKNDFFKRDKDLSLCVFTEAQDICFGDTLSEKISYNFISFIPSINSYLMERNDEKNWNISTFFGWKKEWNDNKYLVFS